jgi:lipoprotein-anchoring transpeptidase ErfK/SrfK
MIRKGAAALLLLAVVSCSKPSASPNQQITIRPIAARPSPTRATPHAGAESDPIIPGPGTYAAIPNSHLLTIYPKIDGNAAYSYNTDNPLHVRAPMLVTGARRDQQDVAWVRLQMPFRPNGHEAWVHASDITLKREDQKIVVDLRQRTLRWWDSGKLLHTFSVGIGTPQTPTTTGTYYVWERIPQPNPDGPYGVFALGLSAFSRVETNWPGGGRIGIHGTPFASDQGNAVSHGCVRVFNPQMILLEKVPLGTPVMIRQ